MRDCHKSLCIIYNGFGEQCSTSINGSLVYLPKQQEVQSEVNLVVLTIDLFECKESKTREWVFLNRRCQMLAD